MSVTLGVLVRVVVRGFLVFCESCCQRCCGFFCESCCENSLHPPKTPARRSVKIDDNLLYIVVFVCTTNEKRKQKRGAVFFKVSVNKIAGNEKQNKSAKFVRRR